ncbi:MMPL family transporter [Micrococcoides hystricis]|uniref:MMPL family transporter n=1 Tax=Micrococcoides hystricis TaxID=1572761 RepID=A0ABV6PCZ7_9MICC
MNTQRLLRILLPLLLIGVWLAGAGFGGPTFGKISSVSSNEQATFLPADAESTRAIDWQEKFSEEDVIPAVVVITDYDQETLGREDLAEFGELSETLKDIDGVVQAIGPIPNDEQDPKAVQFTVLLDTADHESTEVVEELRDVLSSDLNENYTANVTGPAGLSADLGEAFSGIDGLLLIVALVAVFVILIIVYRSVLLPIIVLMNSVTALSVAILGVYFLAKEQLIQLNGQSQGILSILVIGAATDYSLLLVARYREELMSEENHISALLKAWRASLGAILASGGTVIAALLLLLFSELNSNRSLGPIAAIGIVAAMAASLTFLPALLAVGRRVIFWPSIPKFDRSAEHASDDEYAHPRWRKISQWVQAHARPVWIITLIALLAGAGFVSGFRAEGVAQSETILGASDAKEGQDKLEEFFGADIGSPVNVVTAEDKAEQVFDLLSDNHELTDVTVTTEEGQPAPDIRAAKVVEDKVLLSANLKHPADSDESKAVVTQLRDELRGEDPDVLVGGETAVFVDTTETAQRDLVLLVPLILAAVFVILIILLRSFLAPLLLIIATTISFFTALGVSSLVFTHIFGFSGADPTVPLFGFVFLVALGVDYTIFLMTRTREEAGKIGARPGLSKALTVTGSVITSAGIVLATTFAALGVIPLMFMAQLAFLVAFGVLLDTLIVRTLLIPAVGFELGERIWWPAKKFLAQTSATGK